MKAQLDRRLFLGAVGTGLLVASQQPARAPASERVRVAVIGLRNRRHGSRTFIRQQFRRTDRGRVRRRRRRVRQTR